VDEIAYMIAPLSIPLLWDVYGAELGSRQLLERRRDSSVRSDTQVAAKDYAEFINDWNSSTRCRQALRDRAGQEPWPGLLGQVAQSDDFGDQR
jgi:hypothetical protein